MQITPSDLYRLRRAHLMAQRAALRAQYAQQQLQELTLDLERRYGLLTKDAVMELQTGIITLPPAGANGNQAHAIAGPEPRKEITRGPADHADQSPP